MDRASFFLSLSDDLRPFYAIGRDDFSLTSEAARFLVPNADAVNVRSAPLVLPLERIPADGWSRP